jgi:glutathione S-transferase
MITVYGLAMSGNCWKVAQILRSTGRAFRWVEVDSNKGETRTPEFLARNPVGKIPVAELEDGTVLIESNAMLAHFAEGTPWLPPPGLARTRVFEWLFFEQYSHEPAIAVRRALSVYPERRSEATPERMTHLLESGNRALAVMEQRLGDADWLAGNAYSLADISLYAYTHMAADGGYDLQRFPRIRRWLARVAAMPRHVAIEDAAPAMG